jgi:hypothetical protein
MTTSRDPDRLIHAFVREGAEQLDDQVYDAVRAEIDQKRQRVVIGPWRVPTMSKLIPIGLGAAALVAVLFIGSRFIGSPSSNVGGPASQPPASAAPSEAPASTAPASAAPSPVSPPPLTESFTSTVHGISVSYPEGWIARAATEPWTDCLYCTLVLSHPQIDLLHRPPDDDGLFLRIASQPIGESAPEDWVAAQMASDERCTTTEPIIVDGATGLSGGDTCLVAVVTTAGRGYHIDLFISPDDDRDLVAQYGRAWFEEVLATVQLHPEDAIDSGASPSP